MSAFVVAAVPGLITGIGSSVYVGKHARAPIGWAITAYLSAALNLAASALALVPVISNGSDAGQLGLSIGSFTIGAFDIVMAALGQTMPLPQVTVLNGPHGQLTVALATPTLRW